METIPVLKPKLPDAQAILPYLQQIDKNRWYGNIGPLTLAYEQRLVELFASPAPITLVANGTLGLTVALQALEVERGTHCLMPSWTFTATPAAALAAGLIPAFMDVDLATQAITPQRVKAVMKSSRKKIGAVMPVSAFGAPIDVQAWDRFTEETGIPVVIDAAAAFDSFASKQMAIGRTPVMVSLHATKINGIGEGGLILTASKDIATHIRRIINFGFENDRLSHRVAINAKGSEYNAALGMAVLDAWGQIRKDWSDVQRYYCMAFAKAGIDCWMSPNWVTTTCNVLIPDRAAAIARSLKTAGIDTRRWWETGCHAHPAYRSFPVVDELTNTQYLGQTMLGLPGAMDMNEAQLQRVVSEVVKAVGTDAQSKRASA